jgi:hypothetical protein
MPTKLPQRHVSHQLEEESNQFFRSCLPKDWTCDEPDNDYGIDFRVGLADNGYLNGQALVVQLKASLRALDGKSVRVRMRVSTVNYLINVLEVAMLVMYVKEEKEAYWILLKDVPRAKQDASTITVHIPRSNVLSRMPWPSVTKHVNFVHNMKLGAMHSANEAVQ